MSYAAIAKILDEAINEVNDGYFLEPKIETCSDAELLGSVDSVHMVALLVAIEERVEQRLGKQVCLVDDVDLLKEGGPLQTVGALTAYLSQKVL